MSQEQITDLKDQNMSIEEIQQFEVNKKDMNNRNPLGFDRKFKILSNKKQQYSTNQPHLMEQGYFQSLDLKAYLVSMDKGLANYNTKAEVVFKVENGKSIPFITWNSSTEQFEFSDAAQEAIQTVRGPISFISVAGLPQSGKSTLMNLILSGDDETDQVPKMFKSEQDESTKGLMMWSEPTFNPQTGCWVFFLDSQEYLYEGVRQDREKLLFLISCLISSVLIVNTQGPICDKSLLPCADLYNLNEYLELDYSNQENRDDLKFINAKDEIASIFPKMLYVFRDFQNVYKVNGKMISWNQYLANFLIDDEAFTKGSKEEKKIRRRMVKYFKVRNAHSLVHPLKNQDESQIKNMPIKKLDQLFQDEIKILRKKIIHLQSKKEFRGVFFTSTMMLSFINSILEDVNQKLKIDLIKAFEILIENEFIQVYNDSIDIYNNFLSEKFADNSFKSFQDLHLIFRQARETAQDNFYSLKSLDTPFAQKYFADYIEKLKQMIQEKESKVLQCNSEEQVKIIQNYTEKKIKEIESETKNGQFKIEDINVIIQQYEQMMHDVMEQCMGGTKDEPMGTISTKILSDMSNLFLKEINESKKRVQETDVKIQNDATKLLKSKEQTFSNKLADQEQKQQIIKQDIIKKENEKKQTEENLKKQEIANQKLDAEKVKLLDELKNTQKELEVQKNKSCCQIF